MNWLQSGVTLKNNYIIKKKVAVSDLSIVYIGCDSNTKEKCIIKEYYPHNLVLRDMDNTSVLCKMPSMEHKYQESIENFFNEAIILSKLNHKNIVKYIDHFVENNTGYIIIKYYKGKTLDKYIREEKNISVLNFFKTIFIPIMDAVDEIHKKGLIHRDIKPTNIIITKKGIPVIIDFGSAASYKDHGKYSMFVTPGFSPIEFYSKLSKQGRYSDIYSISATLYYYLSGKVPLEAPKRVIEDRLDNINLFNEEISNFLAKAVMKNLSLDYKKRNHSLGFLKTLIYFECFWMRIKEDIGIS